MAIDLPPAIPPQQADVQILQQRAQSGATYGVGAFQVRVTGNTLLSAEQLQAALAGASNPSEAVLQLAAAYVREGHMMVSVHYGLDGTNLYVMVHEGYLDKVIAPPALVPFFEGFVGQKNLTRAQLDRKLVLADIKSARAGQDVNVTYTVDGTDPQKVTMIFTATPKPEYDPTLFTLEFGNPGNRFLGRYFVQAGVRHSTQEGAEYVAAYTRALTSLGNARGGKHYNLYQINLNHPTPLGLYGFDVGYTDYSLEVANVDFDAETIEVGLTGQQLVWSDKQARLTLNQRLEHIESEILDTSTGIKIQDEPHSSAAVGVAYTRDMSVADRRSRLSASVAAKTGVSNDEGTLNKDGPAIIGGRRTAEFIVIKPKAAYATSIFTNGTFGLDFLSQIADQQLPEHQQWSLGGSGSLSAYLPGVLEGDTGYYLRASLEFAARPLWQLEVKPSVFLETGGAQFEKVAGGDDMRRITDAGFRLAMKLTPRLTMDLVWAKSLSESNLDSNFLDDLEANGFFTIKGTF